MSNVSVSGTITCNYKKYLEPTFSNWIIGNNAQTTAPAPADIESTVTVIMSGAEDSETK